MKVKTPSGWQEFEGIRKTVKKTAKILLSNGKEIRASLDHRFIINHEEVLCRCLKPGQLIFGNVSVVSISLFKEEEVFDLINVGNGNVYFHDEGVASHNCFLGSANTLLSSATLRRLVHLDPIVQSGSLKIFEQPKEGHMYFLSVDCSRGAGIDYSSIQVSDISEYPFKQVAVFHDNKTNHYLLPKIVVEIAKKYNEGYVLVEINDIGEAVADSIYFDYEYENLLTTGESKGKIALGSWKNSRNGVRTTKTTKREGCSIIKALIESNKYEVRDWTTIQEFSTFISKNNSYEADDMCHDDTVMALVVFAWATGQEFFKEIMQKDFRKTFIEESLDTLMEELSPIGYFDGFEDQQGEWQAVD